MKYIIDIPDNTHWIQWIMEGTKDHHPYMDWIDVKDLRFYTEHDRKDIEDEVWEFVRTVTDMTEAQRIQCFGGATCNLDDYLTYQEAKSKYEAWEAWLKQKDVITVGDEIISVDDDVKAIMLDCADYESIYVMTEHGCVERWKDLDGVKKTGRTFPEVAELLDKMRGEDE